MPRWLGTLAALAFALAHTVLLHYAFLAVMRRMPADPRIDISHIPPEVRKRKAVFANRVGTLLYMLAWPVLTVGCGLMFWGYSRLAGPHVAGAVYVFRPNEVFYFVVAMVPGFLLCGPAGLLMFRLLFWSRYHEYMACGDKQFNLDIRKFMYVVCVWLIPFTLDWAIHEADWYTVFAKDRIVLSGFWGFGSRSYPYSRVAGVYEVADYEYREVEPMFAEPHYVVVLDDGSRWTSADMARHQVPEDRQIAELVARKSGKPIAKAATLADAVRKARAARAAGPVLPNSLRTATFSARPSSS